MSGGVFQAREVACSRGHVYARPLDAPDALPCPMCQPVSGSYWVIPVLVDKRPAAYATESVAVAAPPVMAERRFKRVRVTHIAGERVRPWMPPRYQWMPGWVEEGASA